MTGEVLDRIREDKRIIAGLAAATVLILGASAVVFFRAAMPKGAVTAEDLRSAKVEHVRSGSKVILDEGEEIAYAGIRALYEPEPLSAESLARNTELVEGKRVRLRFDEVTKDKKERFVAYVFADGAMVNEQLVREGLAYVQLTQDHRRFANELLAAQADARKNRRGVWKLDTPPKETQYSADPKYGNFHRPSCEETPKIKPERRVTYEKRDRALDAGLAPCPKCRP